jgi:hypothetical protein
LDALRNYLTFESNIVDDGVWDENDKVLQPPGLQHSLYLATGLAKSFRDVGQPWNEEDYGWEFLCKVNNMSVGVLIAPFEDRTWLIIVTSAVLLAFLRRKKVTLVQQQVSDAIERLLKGDDRFQQVQRYSQAEFDRVGA